MHQLRDWLELIYFVSGATIAVLAAFGLEQIRVLKKDLAIRVERAAKEKAIEFAGRYYDRFVPLSGVLERCFKEQGLQTYKETVGNFAPPSLTKQDVVILKKKLCCVEQLVSALNELDYISSAFLHRVAHDETGFQIFGRSFCHSVRGFYDVLAGVRGNQTCRYLESTVELYRVWSSRLTRAELESVRGGLDTVLSQLSEMRIPPIGDEGQ